VRIADAHRPGSRGICPAGSPVAALNQIRSSSTIVTVAIGTLKMRAAKAQIRSKMSSGGVSRMA
jgi:hypothetical protein